MIFIRTLISFFRDPNYLDLLYTTLTFLGAGTIIYRLIEGWSWIDSLYFCVITLTTVGYGDYSPQTDGGKLFTIFYIMLGIGLILSFINTVYQHYENTRQEGKKKKKKHSKES